MFKSSDFQSGYGSFNIEVIGSFPESYVSLESVPPFNILNQSDSGKKVTSYFYDPVELIRNADLIKDIILKIKQSSDSPIGDSSGPSDVNSIGSFIKNCVGKFTKGNNE